MRSAAAARGGAGPARRVRGAVPSLQQRPRASAGARRLKVAAIDTPATYEPEQPDNSASASGGDPELEQQLAVQQLDAAQEDLLKWMLFLDADAQEADLDAVPDAEEVGDEEYADLYDEVEGMLEDAEASFKVGDKVYGTVYEVDEDGAYVEIGAKTAGFVPLSECSLGRLKTVGGRGRAGGALGRAGRRRWAARGARARATACALLPPPAAAAAPQPTPPAPASPPPPPPRRHQPLEVLRPGMKREFVVVEDEDEYEEVILSLAAIEVRAGRSPGAAACPPRGRCGAATRRCMRGQRGAGAAAACRRGWRWRLHAARGAAHWTAPPLRAHAARRPRPPSPHPQAQIFWQRIRQMQEEDVPVTVTVVGANRGGLMVQYAHLEGFIPLSHLGQVRRGAPGLRARGAEAVVWAAGAEAFRARGALQDAVLRRHAAASAVTAGQCSTAAPPLTPPAPTPPHPTPATPQNITADTMENYVGYDIPAKFLEVDEESERLVFSHRRASSSTDMQGYKVGDVVVGVVQSVRPYGAFVDIGGAIGLLHISQITHERLTTVDQVLAEGDKLKVMILSADSDRGRVTLSTKKLEQEPGDMLRDPQKVFENADSMAAAFKARVAAADSAAAGGEYPPLDAGLDAAGYPPAAGAVDA
jgi:predicted RNA-binding protein with RPS1 domain